MIFQKIYVIVSGVLFQTCIPKVKPNNITVISTLITLCFSLSVMPQSEFDFRLIFFVITDFSIVAINVSTEESRSEVWHELWKDFCFLCCQDTRISCVFRLILLTLSPSQIYSILCVFSQFQEYSSGRGLPGGDLERRYSRSWTHPDPQVELTTAFVISSIADPPTTEEVMTKSPNGRCHSAFKGTFSPTKSTSINSSTFIPREDDDDDDVDVEQQHELEEVNCVSSFDHLTESSCLQNERRSP